MQELLLTGAEGWLIYWYLVYVFLADILHYKYPSIHNPATMSSADYGCGIKRPFDMEERTLNRGMECWVQISTVPLTRDLGKVS